MHLYKIAAMSALANAALSIGVDTRDRPPMVNEWQHEDRPSPMALASKREAKKRQASNHKFRGQKRRAFDHG